MVLLMRTALDIGPKKYCRFGYHISDFGLILIYCYILMVAKCRNLAYYLSGIRLTPSDPYYSTFSISYIVKASVQGIRVVSVRNVL